jgi:MFS family permease
VVTGMALGVVGMFLFTRLTPTSTYAANVLPGLLVIGLGLGFIFAPAIGTATLGVEAKETGVASAVVNACQQIGGSIGLALLSTISASAATSYAETHARVPGVVAAATVHGYTTAFWWAAGIFAIGLLMAIVVLPAKVRPGECSVRKALSRGLAYAHHLEPADGAPTAEREPEPVGAGRGGS